MSIKLAGLSSNLDTDSIISALVSAYSVNKDNLVKAQTKLSWKKDSWKAMNTKIYNFYSKSLANMRLTNTYSKKTASITNTSIAKVTAGTNTPNGTQTLLVTDLASSGYLTGGTISTSTTTNGTTVTGDPSGATKLSQVQGMSAFTSGTITVGANGKTTNINLTSDMTIDSFIGKLKDAGVNASFDDTNNRIFISAKASGSSNDYTLTAGDQGGLTALQSLQIFTTNSTDMAEYTKWANYTADEITQIKLDTYNASKATVDSVTKEYKDAYDTANNTVTTLSAANTQLSSEVTKLEQQKSDSTLTQSDIDAIDKQISTLNQKITDNNTTINNNKTIMTNDEKFVILPTDTQSDIDAKNVNIQKEVDTRNVNIQNSVNTSIDNKVAMAKKVVSSTYSGIQAVRTTGADSSIMLNGVKFTSSTNNYSVNGLTIQVLSKTTDGAPAMITTDTDVDGIYNMIKGFFTEYNSLISSMDTAYNADSSKGYEPLTDTEKESMTDAQIEKWESKIKDSLLRKDGILSTTINSFKTQMMGSFTVNNQKCSLATFGISTLSYFTAGTNEKGAYHIDGDTTDSYTSGNTDKLRAAIAADPDKVINYFTQLSTSIYNDLTKRMKSSTLRSAYTIYNDKQMATEYSEYTTKISKQEEKISTMEDYYNRRFTAMESALSKLNANTSSLSNLLK